jgi:hypothetical protein
MSRLLVIVLLLLFLLPGAARAGCTVTGMEDQVLNIDEPVPGAWSEATEAVHEVYKKAKIYGLLFEGVFGGSFKVQEIRKEMDAADAEWDEILLLAQDHVMRFDGTCAGEILAETLRKAERFREPERNLVLGVLGGKPVQASTKQVHEGREQDYLQFERRFLRILEAAKTGGEAPVEEPPADEVPADDTGGDTPPVAE